MLVHLKNDGCHDINASIFEILPFCTNKLANTSSISLEVGEPSLSTNMLGERYSGIEIDVC